MVAAAELDEADVVEVGKVASVGGGLMLWKISLRLTPKLAAGAAVATGSELKLLVGTAGNPGLRGILVRAGLALDRSPALPAASLLVDNVKALELVGGAGG